MQNKLQQSLIALEIQKQYINSLTNQIERVQLAINEHQRAKETLSKYIKLKDGNEILIPIGANSYVFANKTKTNKAIVGIGANVSVEEDLEKAIERIEKKLKILHENGEELTKELANVEQQASLLSEKIRKEIEKGRENVSETKRKA